MYEENLYGELSKKMKEGGFKATMVMIAKISLCRQGPLQVMKPRRLSIINLQKP